MWRPAETVGQRGSEDGIIVQDFEHDSGARITLERGCTHAPWSVTCGIYGWFFHTRFLGSEAEAEFDAMSTQLIEILHLIPKSDDFEIESDSKVVYTAIQAFVDRFP